MKTPEQASEYRCPLTAGKRAQTNAVGQQTYDCIGDACMLWRWEDKDRDTSDCNINVHAPRKGYFGLGGRD